MFVCKSISILNATSGERLVARYYPIDQRLKTKAEQIEFERTLFTKTARQNSEIITFDNYAVVYRTIIDATFFVVGSSSENELILLQILTALIESISQLLRDRVDHKSLFENIDLVFLTLDELIDDGIILEIDPQSIAQRIALKQEDVPLSEQSFSQTLQSAKDSITKAILK